MEYVKLNERSRLRLAVKRKGEASGLPLASKRRIGCHKPLNIFVVQFFPIDILILVVIE